MTNKLMEKIQEQARQMAEREAARASYGGFRLPFWKPDKGAQNKIRPLPAWTSEGHFADQFWREVGQHWNVTEGQAGPVVCPQRTEGMDDPCPICDFCDLLREDKTDLSKQKLFKEIKAKKAYLFAVIDLNDPEYTQKDVADFKGDDDCPFEPGSTKVQVYACPVTAWNDIIVAISSNQNDITDLKVGRDLTVVKTVTPGRKLKTSYTVSASFDPSEALVPDDFKTPSMEKVGWHMNHSELLELLSGGVGGDHIALLPTTASGALPEDTDTDRLDDDGGYLAGENDTPEEEDIAAQMRASLDD